MDPACFCVDVRRLLCFLDVCAGLHTSVESWSVLWSTEQGLAVRICAKVPLVTRFVAAHHCPEDLGVVHDFKLAVRKITVRCLAVATLIDPKHG